MNEHHEECTPESIHSSAGAIILTTERLILRVPHAEDAPAIAQIANNRRIAEQTRRIPHPYFAHDAEEWIKSIDASRECAVLVTRKDDKEIVGVASYFVTEKSDTEIGYWIGEPHWGQGFATEAAHAVIDHAFMNTPLELLYGHCRVANVPSRRVLMKCGFQLAGSGMCDSAVLSGLVPVEVFMLERAVWTSLKRWGAR